MGGRPRARLAALALLLGSSLLSENARAYCRSRTCRHDLDTGSFCKTRGICIVEGIELFRKSSCTSYTVNEEGYEPYDISAKRFNALVGEAFDRWLSVDCGGGERPSLRVESFGIVSCDEVSYNSYSGNVSVFVFRGDWALFDVNAFALTTVSFEKTTGEIYDVDVEINGTIPNLVIDDPAGGVDLASILTHEVGHFLGLAHSEDVSEEEPSSDASPVMRQYYTPYVDDLTELRVDDVEGICSAYPPDRKTDSDSCYPRHGFARDCRFQPLEARGGCAFVPGANNPGGLSAAAMASLLFGSVRRFRRRRRAP